MSYEKINQLENCPNCGSEELSAEDYEGYAQVWMGDWGWFHREVRCENCGYKYVENYVLVENRPIEEKE